MCLALVTYKFAIGDDQERVNYEIAKAALDAGHIVWLVACEIAPELAVHPGARTVHIGVAGWPSAPLKSQVFALKSALWLRRARRRLGIVHVNGFEARGRADGNATHFMQSAWLHLPNHPARVRGGTYGLAQQTYTRLNATLGRWAYRRSALVVAVSRQRPRSATKDRAARQRD
jgi:hypothetical protein